MILNIEFNLVFDCYIYKQQNQMEIYLQSNTEENIFGSILYTIEDVKGFILNNLNLNLYIVCYSLNSFGDSEEIKNIIYTIESFYKDQKKKYSDII